MKKLRILAVILTALMVLTGGAAQVWAQQPDVQPAKVRVGFFSFASFQEVDGEGRYSGYGHEYLQELTKYANWEYEYVTASWDECLNMLERGEIDLLGSAQHTAERAEVFDSAKLESGVSYASLNAAANNREIAYEDFEAFDGMSVGLLEGNSRNDRLTEYCAENKFSVKKKYYATQEGLTNALHAGQVDTILTSNLRKEENERTVAKFAPSPFYFVTTKGNREVLDKLNYAQSQIKLADPYFDQRLYDKYYAAGKADQPVFTRAEREYIQQAGVIRASYNPDWGPIEHRDEKTGAFKGIVADIFDTISTNTGLQFEYQPVADLKTATEQLETGDIDIICAFNTDFNAAADYRVTLTNRYLTSSNVMVTNPDKTCRLRTVAITPDFLPTFQKSAEKGGLPLAYYPTTRECFEALRMGEVSAVYADTYVANMLRAEYRFSRFNMTALANMKNELCVAVPRATDLRLLTVINKAVQYLSEEELQEIIVENTTYTQNFSVVDLIYQKPVESIAIISLLGLLVIACLVYVAFLRNRSNKQIYSLLYLDSLTGIWNLNRFRLEMNRVMLTDQRVHYALIYSDIEHFKEFNDAYGYAQGDRVLRAVGAMLREYTEPDESYARVANDNFVALLKYQSEEALIERLKLFEGKLLQIPKNDGEFYRLAFTSGIYRIQQEDRAASYVIDCANDARKTIKGSHKSAYAFFDDALHSSLLAQREVEEVMERALADGQFIAYYQPKVDLKTSKIFGAEALVRWNHPQRGLIPPYQFVPIFEKNGFIIEMDFYVFELVCKTIRRQIDQGMKPVAISSNFSRVHFVRSDFIGRIAGIVERYQIPPCLLEVEITESTADENAELLLSLLAELRDRGFLVAMDDFGSGYSSLNLLKKLPVDTLKLDKDFLQKGFVSEKDRIIIEGFVNIARKLNISVVCEGVETQEQVAFLRNIGCDLAQGYLFARPMPLDEFEDKLYYSDGILP